ncbi:UDP-N-acetylglucosamine-peptide N-acetylglucosaminyltransferase [Methylocystis rosea]|uniref:O-linked N-acetylglucosamine transferase, SPINDLY family protein n=1 Tax=Methylocystis rosea TaxID=173366 RepID=UPI0003A5A6B0|nr:UDP-N-acetylglucosamine-peptide N-acetylglucosaminyltransferase [Methylocystis rosea]
MKSISRSRAMCEWDDFDTAAPQIRAALALSDGPATPPFLLLSEPGITAGEQRACSESWTAARLLAAGPLRASLAMRFDLSTRSRIRVGYLSNDFHEHATAHLLVETLEAHDRARFEIRAYSYCGVEGAMRTRLRAAFDAFADISQLTDAEAARLINADGVDILIDLKGFTHGARTSVMMLRPAPVQVNYLGYPGTLGTGVCDYIVTDRYVTPPSSASAYSEAFAYLPHAYQPHGRGTPLRAPPSRAAAGLPAEGFVYCCFNQAYKLTPFIFDLWARLLEATPGAVLWLSAAMLAEGNLRNEMRRRGIDAARMIFAPHLPQAEHLARLQLADLALDTAPFGSHTTASDALWAGVPIVTCAGDTFPSRVAGSLLHAIGLPELIAADFDEYLEIALVLAGDPVRCAELRAKLAANRLTTALFDVYAYTRALESLFEDMWRRRLAGAPPVVIGAL